MTLLANGFTQSRGQLGGVNNGVIRTFGRLVTLLFGDVQFTRSVAALAADRITLENGPLIVILGVLDGPRPVAMAKQTDGRDRASAQERLVKARLQSPNLLLGIPADG